MTTTFAIRYADNGDIPAMAALLQDLFSLEADFEPRPEVQVRGLTLFLEDTSARAALVAEAEGTVRGMATAQLLISTAEGGPAALVEDMIVADGWRGRGMGRALLQGLARWAGERGAHRLQLLADRNNCPGLAFYERVGWLKTGLICLRTRISD